MKILILSLIFFGGVFAKATDPKYDPAVLVQEKNTEYTRYLKSLFDQAEIVPVQKAKFGPRLKKGLPGYKYRTEIRRQTLDKEVNFAGHWMLVVVGCGTGCGQFFLVDGLTGTVVDPDLMTVNGVPLFMKDRNLIVTLGSIGEETLEDAKKGVWGGPKVWKWTGSKFEEILL